MTTQELILEYRRHLLHAFSTPAQWLLFLQSAGNLYKYSFPNQILLHYQIDAPKAVATFDQWERLGRGIRRGERGAYAFRKGATGFSKSYFDISSTIGAENTSPKLWLVDTPQKEQHASAALINHYGITGYDADAAFEKAQSSHTALQYFIHKLTAARTFAILHKTGYPNKQIDLLQDAGILDFITDSVEFVVLGRSVGQDYSDRYLHNLQRDYDYHSLGEIFSETATLHSLGIVLQRTSNELLTTIERGIKHEHQPQSERNSDIERASRNQAERQQDLPSGSKHRSLFSGWWGGNNSWNLRTADRRDHREAVSTETGGADDAGTVDSLPADGRPSVVGSAREHDGTGGAQRAIPEHGVSGEGVTSQASGTDSRGNGGSGDETNLSGSDKQLGIAHSATASTPTLKELLIASSLIKEKEETPEEIPPERPNTIEDAPPEEPVSVEEKQVLSIAEINPPEIPEDTFSPPVLSARSAKEECPGSFNPSGIEKVEKTPEQKGFSNFFLSQIPGRDVAFQSSAKARFDDNVSALTMLSVLEEDGRFPTEEEQIVLARYAGWGGLADAFEENKSTWSTQYQQLKKLLSPADYRSARASTLTSFYTPIPVIAQIYDTVERLGLQEDARILDPCMGTGRFFLALPQTLQKAQLTGVEIDNLSARISTQLFPTAVIHHLGYEQTDFLDHQFDCIVSNIPFANLKPADSHYNKHGFLLHDYFFAKSLDKVRAGGIVVFITSSGTMDKERRWARKYLAERSDLLGAVRLPNNTFSSTGTDVTTDILFLQKRHSLRDLEQDSPHWLDTEIYHTYAYETGKDTLTQTITLNRYFIEHPEMRLGNLEITSSAFGKQIICTANPETAFEEQLQTALGKISGAIPPPILREEAEEEATLPAPASIKNYAYTVISNEMGEESVYYRKNTRLYPTTQNAVAVQRIKGMDNIRRAARQLTEAQSMPDTTDKRIQRLQEKLNHVYDSFVEKYGYLHNPTNKRLFHGDVDSSFILALEKQNPKIPKEYLKEDVFTQRVVSPVTAVTSAQTAQDAMFVVRSQTGKLDFDRIQALYPKPIPAIIAELGDSIYRNPALVTADAFSGWELSADYLSGDIRAKIKQIQYRLSGEERTEDYRRNLGALQKVLPPPLKAGDISIRIGAAWVDREIYTQFMWEIFGTPSWLRKFGGKGIYTAYDSYLDKWKVCHAGKDTGVGAKEIFGTSRVSAYHIFETTLNMGSPKVYDRIDNKSILNEKETRLARGKQKQMLHVFDNWVYKDPERRYQLEEKYNRLFNSIALKKYDGSYLQLPFLSPDFIPRDCQRNAAARIIDDCAHTLLDHEVGVGKTATMIIGAFERIRLGLSNRVIFTVPNHITEQFGKSIYALYPMAKVMVAEDRDFEKESRQEFLSRIAMSDVNMIVLGHTQFTRIAFSAAREEETIESEIAAVMAVMARQRVEEGGKHSTKQMESKLQSLRFKLQSIHLAPARDHMITFEELGVDTIMVDEADLFKNCYFSTKLTNVAGIGTSDSQRANDMLDKTRYIDTFGGKIVFATGTPLSNAVSEMYVMQRYLQERLLKELGIYTFDQWVSVYASTVTQLEPTPEGNSYRLKTRLAEYYNLAELMKLYGVVADCVTAEEAAIERPALETGEPITVVCQPLVEQLAWMQAAVPRCQAIRSGTVLLEEDNMLKFSHEAKIMSIDLRLLDPTAPPDPTGKIAALCRNVKKYYDGSMVQRGTQLIFSDMGTPNKDKFDVYHEIKEELILAGIPIHEIRFIHEASNNLQKEEIFEQMRQGTIRVLIASTGKCGAGTNIQDRMRAIHHLDCPYRPRDLTQRNGRGWRQGNLFPEIAICQYVTEGTFDPYSWNILVQKQRFIQQIRKGNLGERTYVDKDSDMLNFETVQAIASGDPLMQEKMTVDREINDLKFLSAEFRNQQYRLQDEVATSYPERISQKEERIAALEADIRTFTENTTDTFRATIQGNLYQERVAAGEVLLGEHLLYRENQKLREAREIGSYGGLRLLLVKKGLYTEPVLELRGAAGYTVEVNPESAIGTITRLENMLEHLPEQLVRERNEKAAFLSSMEQARTESTAVFPHADELQALLKREAELAVILELKEASVLTEETEVTLAEEVLER